MGEEKVLMPTILSLRNSQQFSNINVSSSNIMIKET